MVEHEAPYTSEKPPARQAPSCWQRLNASPTWRYLWGVRRHTTLYTLLGILLAILCLTLGPGKTLVIVIFAFIGMLIGSVRDGDMRLLRLLSRFFKR